MRAIISKNIVTPDKILSGAIIVKDGMIEDICASLPASFPAEIDDVGELTIMPGMIDPHVHINEPGRTEWEGFATATQAAAMGGVTTIVDMPLNSSPVTTNITALQSKLEAAKGQLFVDCGFWGGITSDSIGDLPLLVNSGVLGLKCFLIDSGIDEFSPTSIDDLRKAMPIIAKANLPLLAHAEFDDGQRIDIGSSYQKFLASRPKSWENESIKAMIVLAEEFSCKVHIVHLSSADALEMIQTAKSKHSFITVETCPHYICLAAEDIPDGKPVYKCCPPIRERKNNERLWQALKHGTIDFIASDHSPAPPEIKQLESGNLEKAWGGIASVQFTLPLLWTKARKDNFSLTDIGKMISRTAKFIGYESKGEISIGKVADLVVWNPEEEFRITETNIFHRHKCTPYLGNRVYGKVHHVYLRGRKIVENQKLIPTPQGNILLNNCVI